ncbi:hypothetical protein DdX_04042 [Ditylenchus destructor]|uniref:Uncharacterized protein n=1 Tax=Ditylenchus destructor TaxID=166010 RepID=A0AAD4R5D9_9BILA|nr:hypothetical protein DdX_04042 [Ditylenchus destructor]
MEKTKTELAHSDGKKTDSSSGKVDGLNAKSTDQPAKAKPAPKSQPYSPLQARTIERGARGPTKMQSTSSTSKPRENRQNNGRNLSRANNSPAVETHTWDREWDSGKLPVENWKMNVPDIGDSAQGSRHFRPLTTHRYGSNPLRRRGVFSMSAARPSATAQFRPLRNPGFFHDDRFDDIVEGVTKNTVPKATSANTSSKSLDKDLPEAVRGKKIAARLSVVNKQNTTNTDSSSKAAHRPQRPQLVPVPLASALRSTSSQFSHRKTGNRVMKNDVDNPSTYTSMRKSRNSDTIVSAQIRHPNSMSNATGRKQNSVEKNKATDEKISKENSEKAARENKNSERQRRMPKTRASAQPWRIATKGSLLSNSDESTEIRRLLDNLLDQVCTEIDGMKVEEDSSNNKSQDVSLQNENSKTSDETEV